MTVTTMPGMALNDHTRGVRNRVKATVHSMQRATGHAKERVEIPVRQRPVRSILVTAGGAVLLGFLAGMLTGRKTA